MAGRVLRVAVTGAETLLGKELLDEINGSAASLWDVQLFGQGEELEGQLTSIGDEALVVQALRETSFQGMDLAFFAGTAEEALAYGPKALQAGAAVVDLTGALREQDGFLLRSPWVEAGPRADLMTRGVVVPHPAALMLAVVRERLAKVFERADLVATVLEPASASGAEAVDELHQQTVGLLSFQEVPKTIFDAQLAFNVLGETGEQAKVDLAAVTRRVRAEAGALAAGKETGRLSLRVLEAPVFHGYLVQVYVSTPADASESQVRGALEGVPVSFDEDTPPSNRTATESGKLLASFAPDTETPQAFWLLLAGDNLRMAAQSAVLSAQELLALRPSARVQ